MEKSIQKLLDKLGKKGFDTEKKVSAIDMQVAFDNGFTTEEVGGILALQKAIKGHNTYAFIMGGSDTKPDKKEVKRNADDGITEGAGIRTETYENEGY
jgi:hypothetical protein